MHFNLSTRTARFALSLSMVALLAACGGGGGGSNSAGAGSDAVSLKGQVIDGPIAGAQVCLLSNGVPARNGDGAAICSVGTDAEGNYTLTIPRNLASGFLTLVATKGSDIKLASSLGTLDQLLTAAAGGVVTPAELPSSRVTHLTTAAFVIADANNDGTVTQAELNAAVPDFSTVQKVASAIKAVIDYGQSSLIGGQTTDTLSLAAAAARNEVLGTTGQTADQWLADPANAGVIAAVNTDVAATVEVSLANYAMQTTALTANIPQTVTRTVNGSNASIYCSVPAVGTVESDQLSFGVDAARRIAVIQFAAENDTVVKIVGSYDPATGAVSLDEYTPKSISQVGNVATFWHDGYFKMSGILDSSGNFTGTYSEMSATTWSIDSTRQACTGSGTLTLTRQL